MKALVVEKPGDQSIASLKMVDVATPHPGKGQVLVEVHATAI